MKMSELAQNQRFTWAEPGMVTSSDGSGVVTSSNPVKVYLGNSRANPGDPAKSSYQIEGQPGTLSVYGNPDVETV